MARQRKDKASLQTETLVRDLLQDMIRLLNLQVGFRVMPSGPFTCKVALWGPDVNLLQAGGGRIWKAFSFLMQHMAARSMERTVNLDFVITEDDPRKEELRALALRAAREVMRRGKPVFLKPMPAWERRIIHMTLQDHPHVYTRSHGEEPHRRVGIFLKRAGSTPPRRKTPPRER